MLIRLGDTRPRCHAGAWVAPGAVVVGDVELGDACSVWYAAVVRADLAPISLGARSNVQDGAVLHADPGFPLQVGEGVTVGHRAVLHGCRIEADVIVGMGAVVMNGAVVGTGSVVAAGALLPEGTVVPPRSLVMGAPARVRRETTDEELALVRASAQAYVDLAVRHAAGVAAD